MQELSNCVFWSDSRSCIIKFFFVFCFFHTCNQAFTVLGAPWKNLDLFLETSSYYPNSRFLGHSATPSKEVSIGKCSQAQCTFLELADIMWESNPGPCAWEVGICIVTAPDPMSPEIYKFPFTHIIYRL